MTSKLRRLPVLSILILGLLSAVAVGCGERDEDLDATTSEPFDLALDFSINPDHVGIYMALDRGYFEEAGLEVTPRVPNDPAAPIKQVAAGQVDLAISYEPEVMLARDEGIDVVAVGAMVQEPLTSLISLGKEKIRSPKDLEGKTIATAGISYQDAYLEAILRDNGLTPDDVKSVNVGFDLLPAVLSGRANAMLGGFRNVEGVDLKLRGKNPRVVPVNELGIPTYNELVLVASGKRLEEDPEAIRLFIAALERGTRDAVADPVEASRTLREFAPELETKLTLAEVRATVPLLAGPDDEPYGFMDPQAWNEFAGFLADRGITTTRFTADEVLTNEYLPGNISEKAE